VRSEDDRKPVASRNRDAGQQISPPVNVLELGRYVTRRGSVPVSATGKVLKKTRKETVFFQLAFLKETRKEDAASLPPTNILETRLIAILVPR
jgi:hypothetical protein